MALRRVGPGGRGSEAARRRFALRLSACLVGFACAAAAVASSASAVTPTGFTWTGQSTSANWSDANNWGGTAPANNEAALTFEFPALTACSPPKTCFTTTNDVSSLSANTLRIDLGATYDIGGSQPLSLTGGLT